MNKYRRVRRASRALPSAFILSVALTGCDAGTVAPTTIAPTSATTSVDATDAQGAHIKAGQYAYIGCFTEASRTDAPVPPLIVSFDPPVCIPVTLEILEDGRWSIDFPFAGFTAPDHPGWTFFVGDNLGWASTNGTCSGAADPNFPMPATCISEPRYVKKMVFSDFVEGFGLGGIYRVTVDWTYAGKP